MASCRGCGIEMTESNRPPPGSKAEAEGRCSGCAKLPPGWIVFLILGGILALGYVFLQ